MRKYILAPVLALIMAVSLMGTANAADNNSTAPNPPSNYGTVFWNNDAQVFGVQTYWPSSKSYDYTIAKGQKSSRASSFYLGSKPGGWCVYYRYNSNFGGNPSNPALFYPLNVPSDTARVVGPFKWDVAVDFSRNVEVHIRARNYGTC